jgi:uncharacterized protein
LLLLLSPAKKLHAEPPQIGGRASKPEFVDQAELLIAELRKFSAAKLAKFMKLSPALAEQNVQRYVDWKPEHRRPSAAPCILTFAGEVYFEMKAATFSADDFVFAQQHLRILSGLYGVLRPMDLIHPYRLEMGRALANPNGTNLYEYWGEQVRLVVQKQLKKQGDGVIVNLASKEYFKVVQPKELVARVITPQFKEKKGDDFRMIGVFAKKARGLMARYVVQNQLTEPQQLKKFRVAGYRFNAGLSQENDWVFTRG